MPGYGYLCLGMIFIKSESTHHNLSTIYSLLPKISNRELSLPPLSIFPVIASPLPFFLSLRLPHFSPVIVAPFFSPSLQAPSPLIEIPHLFPVIASPRWGKAISDSFSTFGTSHSRLLRVPIYPCNDEKVELFQ